MTEYPRRGVFTILLGSGPVLVPSQSQYLSSSSWLRLRRVNLISHNKQTVPGVTWLLLAAAAGQGEVTLVCNCCPNSGVQTEVCRDYVWPVWVAAIICSVEMSTNFRENFHNIWRRPLLTSSSCWKYLILVFAKHYAEQPLHLKLGHFGKVKIIEG